MQWLTQNWIWIVVVIGFLLLMQRGRFFARHGATHGAGMPMRGPVASSGTALDPVSGNAVRTESALTSVRRGQIFYFESVDTRQRFEVDPEKYAANVPAAETHRSRGHGGCC